jgi:membrane protein DedA with SNARE-associated domain
VEELLARLADWCRDYGYPVLFAFVILENAGVPLPGETAVLVAGFLASEAGGYRFSIGWVILLTFMAAVLGDNLGFWAGRRWARPYLQQGRRFLLLTPAVLKKADSYFERWGSWTIFVARFITGLRVVGALAAGTAGMPWRRFLIANAGGAITWATAISLLGFFFGENLRLLEKLLGRGGLIALSALVVLMVAAYSWNRWIRSGPKEPPAAIGPSNHGEAEQVPEISVQELYELYLDTISRCNRNLLNQSDEEIEYQLYEEFEADAWTFLHENSLLKLRNAGYIDDEVVELSKAVREKWLRLENEPRNAAFVRTNQKWHELFDLCERLAKLNSRPRR